MSEDGLRRENKSAQKMLTKTNLCACTSLLPDVSYEIFPKRGVKLLRDNICIQVYSQSATRNHIRFAYGYVVILRWICYPLALAHTE